MQRQRGTKAKEPTAGPPGGTKALALLLACAAVCLAAAVPLLSAKAVGSVALVLGLGAAGLVIGHAAKSWTRQARVTAAVLYLAQALVFVLAGPLGPPHRYNQTVVALLVLIIGTTASLHLRAGDFNEWANRAAYWMRRHRWAEGLAISALSTLTLLGSAEFLAAALARTRLVPFDRPLKTLYWNQPVPDWRTFHITADPYMVPDPHLFWRPATSPPYNSMGFKGAEFSAVKPPGAFRIMTVGDSNTDGPDAGGWPDELRRLLARRAGAGPRFEVINAGVPGYSSLQGLRRLEESLRFGPDLIAVSFGANDAALAAAGPDKDFATRGPVPVSVVRLAYRYKAFLLARYLGSRWAGRAEDAQEPVQPRVSLHDYETNLERMVVLARAAGARVVLLTRPHDPATRRTAPPGNWIKRAPEYNEATARVGQRLRVPVFDAYALFETGGSEAFIDDSHFTLPGHARMAHLLRDFPAREGLLTKTAQHEAREQRR